MVSLIFAWKMIRGSLDKIFFPIAGIAMATATIVAVMGIAKGGRESLLGEFQYMGGDEIIIASENIGDRRDVEYVRRLSFVKSASATDATFKKEVSDSQMGKGIAIYLVGNEDREAMEDLLVRGLNRYNPGARYFLVENRVFGIAERIKMNLHKFTGAIMGVAVLLSGLGAAAFMGGVVRSHWSHIGMLKAMGARDSMIFGIFLWESLIIGGVGGVLGAAAGGILGKLVGNLIRVAAKVESLDLLGTALFAGIMTGIFGSIPAFRAAKLNPVEAIKR